MKLAISPGDIFLFIIIFAIGGSAQLDILPDDAMIIVTLTQYIETAQVIWLAFGALFTLCWCQKHRLQGADKHFWNWVALWWLILLGRSISWGRVYFPDIPHSLFHIIPVILIAALVISLFFRPLRRAIVLRAHMHPIPVWTLAAVIIAFALADAIEHHRMITVLLQPEPRYQELLEEMFECPFMIGLFLITLTMMATEKKRDKQRSIHT